MITKIPDKDLVAYIGVKEGSDEKIDCPFIFALFPQKK